MCSGYCKNCENSLKLKCEENKDITCLADLFFDFKGIDIKDNGENANE